MAAVQAVKAWAAERMARNLETAHRERNPAEAAAKVVTGVSLRDIREHGWAGGPNSEVNKMKRRLKRLVRL